MTDLETYLKALPEPHKSIINHMYQLARQVAGETEDSVSYNMPCLKYHGKSLISIMNTKKHIAIYPYSGYPVSEAGSKLKAYSTSPGTIRFTPDHLIDDDLLTDIILSRMSEIDATA